MNTQEAIEEMAGMIINGVPITHKQCEAINHAIEHMKRSLPNLPESEETK